MQQHEGIHNEAKGNQRGLDIIQNRITLCFCFSLKTDPFRELNLPRKFTDSLQKSVLSCQFHDEPHE